MTQIEDRVRAVLHDQADAMQVPDAHPGEYVARTGAVEGGVRRRGSHVVMAAAAAVLVVAAVGAGLVLRQDEAVVTAPASSAPFRFETPTVLLEAEAVEVIAAGRSWVPGADVVVEGDPGDLSYTTLELTWFDDDTEQRINIYFASDGTEWWATEIRTYNGEADADWIEPAAEGQWFRSPVGSPWVGDLDLANLRVTDMTIQAFREFDGCGTNATPITVVNDSLGVTIEGPGGAYGARIQLLDTATCAPVSAAAYDVDFISSDPRVVETADPDPALAAADPDWARTMLFGVSPGSATVEMTVRDDGGRIVATSELQVTVGDQG